MTTLQAADTLGISVATTERYWSYARAWLHKELPKGEEKANDDERQGDENRQKS